MASDIKDSFLCDMNNKSHLLVRPQRLPCNRTVCEECLKQKIFKQNKGKCLFCNRKHSKESIFRNMLVEHELEDDLEQVAISFNNQLKQKTKEMIEYSKQAEASNILEKAFEFIEQDIEIRVESIKMDLEKLKIKLCNQIDDNKLSDIQKLEQVLRINANFDLENMKKDLTSKLLIGELSFNKFDEFDFSKPTLKSDLALRHLNKMDFIQLKINPFDVCQFIENQFLITSLDKNDHLFVLKRREKNVNTLHEIKSIDGNILCEPTTIAVDFKYKKIYLSIKQLNSGDDSIRATRKIILIDFELKKILGELNEKLNGLLLNPIDIQLDALNEILCILDHTTRHMLLYNIKDSTLDKTIDLSTLHLNQLNYPQCISFNKNFIACVESNEIKIYNLNKSNVFVIKRDVTEDCDDLNDLKIHGICFNERTNLIYAHLNCSWHDKIICYKRDDSADKWLSDYECDFNNTIFLNDPKVLKGSWRMKLFNGNLIITSWSKEIALI